MKKLIDFLKEGIWLIPYDKKRPVRSFLLRCLRVAVGTVRGFLEDECFLKGSALTFYTLLSIIPVFAVAFGVAKGFGFEPNMQRQISLLFRDQPEVGAMITDFSYSLLKHAEGGLIAGVGAVILLWTVLKLLGNIEHTLNAIWRVPNSRHFLRQFTDYMAILILCPIFFVAGSSFTLLIARGVYALAQEHTVFYAVTPIFKMVPYFSSWLLFALLYLLMPNTRVPIKASIIAGVFAGTVYQAVQWFYISFQIGLANYGAIYGSFAALPLFMLWINISWYIVLAGAELAYRIECEETASTEPVPRIFLSEAVLATLIVYNCIRQFQAGTGPTPISRLAKEFSVPLNTARVAASALRDAGILAETQSECYLPGRSPESITIKDIFNAMNPSLEKRVSLHASDEYNSLLSAIEAYQKAEEGNKSLIEL